MKKILVFVAVLFGFFVNGHCQTAQEIVESSWKNFRSVDSEIEIIKLEVRQKSGDVRKKALTRWTRYQDSGDQVAIEFSEPLREKGLKLQIHRNPNEIDQIYLKMPSWGRPRSISARDQSRNFAGTHFAFKDTAELVGEKTSDYSYKILDDKEDCWAIEALPRESKNSVYEKRIIWISKKTKAVAKIQYWKDGRVFKDLFNGSPVMKGKLWRVNEILIKTFDDEETRLKVIDRVFDPDGIERKFTRKFFQK